MAKYLVRYIIFWLPATVLFYLLYFGVLGASAVTHVLQWFFAFFMVLGWSVNTGMAAYHYPRRVFALILLYTGVNVLAIVALYKSYYASSLNQIMLAWGGLFSYNPLDVFIEALLDFNIDHELYVTGFLVLCCLAGWCVSMLYRRLNPNPYRPRVLKGGRL